MAFVSTSPPLHSCLASCALPRQSSESFLLLSLSPLSDLIELINGQLSPNDRKKLITLCTIDVHARDVVQRLIDERVDSVQCFQWQSQLRYYQNKKTKECLV